MDERLKIRRNPPQKRIVLVGSTREGRAATYPRGKVYDPCGISPCILRGSSVTGPGNEIHVLLTYGQPIKF